VETLASRAISLILILDIFFGQVLYYIVYLILKISLLQVVFQKYNYYLNFTENFNNFVCVHGKVNIAACEVCPQYNFDRPDWPIRNKKQTDLMHTRVNPTTCKEKTP
jgi:hypothetical protein